MKRYEAYKSTGLKWFPEIPNGWEWRFLCQVAQEQIIKKPSGEMYPVMTLSYGEIKRKKNIDSGLVPSNYDNYQMLYKGNIVLRLIDLQNDHTSLRTGLVKETGIITSAYTCIAPLENASYIRYLLHSYDTRKVFYGYGGGVRQSIGFKDILHLQVPVPPRDEQDQIVRYLDWQVSKINRLIAAKRKQIDLLKEQKQRKITSIVTKGLNPIVPLKNTRIAWIGSIPAHWNCIPLKRCAKVKSGITLGKQYPVGTNLIEVSYLRVANVQNGFVDTNTVTTLKVTPEEATQYELQSGCVLMTEGGDRDKLGRGCVWNGEIEHCIHQNHIFAVMVDDKLLQNKWLEYVTACDIGRIYFDITAIKTTNLACTNVTKVMAFLIPLPPRDEQERITNELNRITCMFNDAQISLEKQIECLQELRARLISDVVTGQVDVLGIKVLDFEYINEADATDEQGDKEMEEEVDG